MLCNIVVPSCVVHCSGSNCGTSGHLKSIVELYDGFIQPLKALDDLVILTKHGVNVTP